MSEHEDIREQLSAYLDGELAAGDARRVESALAADAALAAELEQLRKTRRLLQSLPRERVGEDFTAKVMQAALQQGALTGGQTWRPAALPNPWRRYLSAAALILFAVGLGIFFSVSLYDAGPPSAPEQELALKPIGEDEGMDSVGTIARDLGELQVGGRKKAEAQPEELAKSYEPGTTGREAVMGKLSRPPDMPGMVMEKPALPAPAEAPAESFFAKGAPARSGRPIVSSKAGTQTREEDGDSLKRLQTAKASKDDMNAKNAPAFRSRKGPAAPYDQPANVLAGPQAAVTLAKNVAPADHEVIYTDDLAAGQKQVEAVLLANAVEITPPEQRMLQPSQATNIAPRRREAGLRMKLAKAPPQQLQYVVYGTPRQLQQVREQLRKDVRAKQTAAQYPAMEEKRNGQALNAAQPTPTVGNQIVQADAKEQPPLQIAQVRQDQAPITRGQPERLPAGQTTTRQAIGLAVAQPPTSQQADAEFRATRQQAPQSQPQAQIHEGLLNNQAMLITLELRPAAKK